MFIYHTFHTLFLQWAKQKQWMQFYKKSQTNKSSFCRLFFYKKYTNTDVTLNSPLFPIMVSSSFVVFPILRILGCSFSHIPKKGLELMTSLTFMASLAEWHKHPHTRRLQQLQAWIQKKHVYFWNFKLT